MDTVAEVGLLAEAGNVTVNAAELGALRQHVGATGFLSTHINKSRVH